MADNSLKDLLQPGKKLRIFYNENNINNRIVHIRAVVDDEYIVFKTWSQRQQRWSYQIESDYYFQLLLEEGRLTFGDVENP